MLLRWRLSVLVGLMGGVLIGLAAPVAAQDDEDDRIFLGTPVPGGEEIEGNIYSNESFDYTVEWDEQIWTATLLAPPREAVLLETEANAVLLIESINDYDGDLATCVQIVIATFLEENDIEQVGYPDDLDGVPAVDGDEASLWVVYSVYSDDGTQFVDFALSVACGTLVPGEAVRVVAYTAPVDVYQEQLVLAQDVIDSIDDAVATPPASPAAVNG